MPTNFSACKSSPSFLTGLFRKVSRKQPSKASPITPATSDVIPVSSTGFEHVFHYFDENGDGRISPAELRNCMQEELSLEDAEEAVRSSDSDGDGLLDMDDFVRLVSRSEEKEEEERSLRAAFEAYEMEGRGCITATSLKRALERLGECKSVGECKEMIREFDIDGDGVISLEEFKIMMRV